MLDPVLCVQLTCRVLQVDGFCLPWEVPCGGNWGCYNEQQRCDGYWHCPNGRDELNCSSCQEDEFPCSRNGACYPRSDRCNYQNRCPNGSDEKNCFFCQPGNFHCKVLTPGQGQHAVLIRTVSDQTR